MTCQLRRVLHVGCTGRDVFACSRALIAAGAKLAPTRDFQSSMHGGVVAFQRHFGLQVDGVIGPDTFSKLRAFVDRYGCWELDHQPKPSGPSDRDLVLGAAIFGVHQQASWTYCECRPIDGWYQRFQPRVATDCSGYAKLAYWWGVHHDLDGLGPAGYTGTLISHGTAVRSPRRADLVFYANPDHVAIVAADTSMVYTFGGEPGPLVRPLRYRAPVAFRSYLA